MSQMDDVKRRLRVIERRKQRRRRLCVVLENLKDELERLFSGGDRDEKDVSDGGV